MAWIYLAASEESQKPSSPGSQPSLTVNKTDTLKLSYFQECLKANSTELQSGMTSQRSKKNHSQKSTLFSAASHVRTYQQRAMALAWKESEAVYSLRYAALWTSASLHSSSWKMCQPFAPKDYIESSKSFPIVGILQDGQIYPLKKLERIISATDGSYLLPTPTASTYGSNQGGAGGRVGKVRLSLGAMAAKNQWPTPIARDWKGDPGKNRQSYSLPREVRRASPETSGQLNPMWVEWLMGYPTGWTELNVSVIQWYRCKQEKPLKSSRELGVSA